jgi:AcrR family transcriptional regulator
MQTKDVLKDPMPSETSPTRKPKRAAKTKVSAAAQETRIALMLAAQKHFSEAGFKAASVHDIARDAGVNVSLVSYHFGSKEGLFKSCLERAGIDRLEIAQRILDCEPTSIEEIKIRLEMFIDEMLLDGVKNPEICAILHRDLHSEFHLIEDIFKKTFLKTFELLAAFLTAAKKKRILDTWVDPDLSAVHIMGAVIHTLKTDPIRAKLFNESINNSSTRIYTRDYIIRTHLEGMLRRPK